MSRMHPEYLDPDLSSRSVPANVLVREEQDDEEDEDDEDEDEDRENNEGDEGYSE